MTERLEIEIAPDQMGASVRVVPGEAVTPEQLTEALTKAGIVFGVSEPAIAELAKNLCSPLFESEAVVVARGQPPRDQSAEGFEALFAVGIRGGHRDRDGSFDFRDRELLKAVHVGDAIARVNPPVTGVSGRSVTGRELPYAVRETSKVPSFGPGVARQPGGAVVAARDGIIVYTEGDVLDVVDLYVHEGDVDIHSGNLNMRGSLTVGGDVAAKFEVQATGDVEIKKSVLGGSVYSANNIVVHGGLMGTGGGLVAAERDVSAQHAQGAVVRCGGKISLEKGAVNCDIRAHSITVGGSTQGGVLEAEHHIIVKDVGGRLGAKTTLAVAAILERPLLSVYQKDVHERHVAARMGAQVVRSHARTVSRRPVTDAEKVEEHERKRRVRELSEAAHVDVLGTAHAGTVVWIGSRSVTLDKPVGKTRFSLDPETLEIVRTPL